MLSSIALILALGISPQHWIANSTTAMSITGNVTFSSTQMFFENGRSISLTQIRKTAQYTLYRVSATHNPSLLRGNTLCGPKLPGFLAVSRNGKSVTASFFWAGIPPSNLNASSLCATYAYAT
jgi:hypothetical protein